MKEETYEMNMLCGNCEGLFTMEFIKGRPCSGFHVCKFCGCKDAKATSIYTNILPEYEG